MKTNIKRKATNNNHMFKHKTKIQNDRTYERRKGSGLNSDS